MNIISFFSFHHFVFFFFLKRNVINGTFLLSCCCKIKRKGLTYEYYFILPIRNGNFCLYIYIYKIVAHVVKESLTFYQILINGTTLLSCFCYFKIKRGELTFEYYFILFLWIIPLFIINYLIISISILFLPIRNANFLYIYIYIYIYIYNCCACCQRIFDDEISFLSVSIIP